MVYSLPSVAQISLSGARLLSQIMFSERFRHTFARRSAVSGGYSTVTWIRLRNAESSAVGGQDQDALVVLHEAKKDRDQGVLLGVFGRAFAQEHVRLVPQQDGVPVLGDPECSFDRSLHLVDRRAQPAASDRVNGSVRLLSDRQGSESLA